jgi:hypothetical protein
MSTPVKNNLSLDYHFSTKEIEILAYYFRKNSDTIPAGLENFVGAVEHTVYDSMSIDEAEKFYL